MFTFQGISNKSVDESPSEEFPQTQQYVGVLADSSQLNTHSSNDQSGLRQLLVTWNECSSRAADELHQNADPHLNERQSENGRIIYKATLAGKGCVQILQTRLSRSVNRKRK